MRVLDRTMLVQALAEARADGWLLFDFQGVNPVLQQVLGIEGFGSRRLFVWLPRDGEPVAVAHRIELQSVAGFSGRVEPYSRWEELHAALVKVVRGRRVAMEISPDNAVPYLDRVPHGVVQLVQQLGGTVVPSTALVTQFASRWSDADVADHLAAAEVLAALARDTLTRAVRRTSEGLTESALQHEVVNGIHAAGLVFEHPPIVGFGPNAANPHYEPEPGADRTLGADEVVLLDLWAGRRLGAVFADQTWMGFSGSAVPESVGKVWQTVRDARDAAIVALTDALADGRQVYGYELDRAARGVIEAAGFGAHFVHRTGHSIDHRLHGSGPHLDDYETHDDRPLVDGVGFSVEPGVYLTGQFGVRSEVNVYLRQGVVHVTPGERQQELIRVA